MNWLVGFWTAAPKVSAPAEVVMLKAPTVAEPPLSLTTCLMIVSWACVGWFQKVQVTMSVGPSVMLTPGRPLTVTLLVVTPACWVVQTAFLPPCWTTWYPLCTTSVTVAVTLPLLS